MILYETLSQGTILLMLVASGFCCGFLFDIVQIFFQKQKIFSNILVFFASLLCYAILFLIVLCFSYGQMRIWHVLVFVASTMLQRASCGHLLAKLTSVCYNFFHKKIKKGK